MESGIIRVLPDNVANKIAAGEVVQRPASVVKELVENAIDAGATQIKIIIKDAGKSLIQIIDNGKGMNALDARLCFERHATSKIIEAEDLFKLSTKGFRGEALASIAAVAQVELKTKQTENETAIQINIDGGKFINQTECQAPVGTSFTIKNLFFNIPARRNFLKSDQIELKHIIDEVERMAIPHINIHFIVQSNGNEILNLPATTTIGRIKSLVGSYIQKELVPLAEDAQYIKISGYVSLPQYCLKTKKEQFFFVNNRYVRNPFLNHAIYEAYKELISFQSHPRYFIFLELDPANIDINIHPTKTEVKFTDDKTAYLLLCSTIKRAIAKGAASDSLNFETETAFNTQTINASKNVTAPTININPSYNPFNNQHNFEQQNTKVNKQQWEKLFTGFTDNLPTEQQSEKQTVISNIENETKEFSVFQMNKKYIVTTYNQNILIVDQQRAHERIVYEHYLKTTIDNRINSQQILFAEQFDVSANDFVLIQQLMPEFKLMGFDLEVFGKNSFIINGIPSDLADFNIKQTIDFILESYKINTIDSKTDRHDNLSRAIAKSTSIKYGKVLQEIEMKQLLMSLFDCENPLYTANGKSIMMEIENTEIEKFFKK
ncbi:MAG: DNA mismatch repair endonuclease MutL [Bacteroidetes bacterium]|nr:DNA mismatch repair endonuclease MutL [Bacteroidota bacterium]